MKGTVSSLRGKSSSIPIFVLKDTQQRHSSGTCACADREILVSGVPSISDKPNLSCLLTVLTQTCFLMSVNVIGQRMDFYAMIHACWLIGVLYRRRRKAIAEVWPKYCCFLACIITFQYFVCIGIPPAPCRGEHSVQGVCPDPNHRPCTAEKVEMHQGTDCACSFLPPRRLPMEIQGCPLQ